MTAKIVGFTGPAGSGKDTAADYLMSKGFVKISFASTLKAMLATAGLPEPASRDDKEKIIEGFPFSWREAAQTLGTEWGRSLDPDIWLKLTLKGLEPDGKYVVSDVRFENEAKVVRENGLLIHLVGRKVDMGDLEAHASEAGVTRAHGDYCVRNTEGFEYLYTWIDYAVKQMSLP